MARDLLQSSPDIPGGVMLQPLLQSPPVAVAAFPYLVSYRVMRENCLSIDRKEPKILTPTRKQHFANYTADQMREGMEVAMTVGEHI